MSQKVIVHDPNYVTDEAVYFYTPQYYAFDNFSAFAVEIWGMKFMTSEHAYQWKKYSAVRADIAEEILAAPVPTRRKKLLMLIKMILIRPGMMKSLVRWKKFCEQS